MNLVKLKHWLKQIQLELEEKEKALLLLIENKDDIQEEGETIKYTSLKTICVPNKIIQNLNLNYVHFKSWETSSIKHQNLGS